MATVTFTVPPSWATVTTLSELSCQATTVGDALAWFAEQYPLLRKRYLTPDGEIAPWALVTLDHIEVCSLSGLSTRVEAEQGEIGIIAALMGG